jgi:hypothetical protein
MFLAHLGDGFAVHDLSQSHVDTHAVARRSGALGDERRERDARGVRDGSVRSQLIWLASLFNFARGFKVGGRPVLRENPLQGLTLPR